MNIDAAIDHAYKLATDIQEEQDSVRRIHMCTGSIVAGSEMLSKIIGSHMTASLLIGLARRILQEGRLPTVPSPPTH